MKFKVLTPVNFDKRYEPGKFIELEDAEAGPLLEVGAIERASKAEVNAEAGQQPAKAAPK